MRIFILLALLCVCSLGAYETYAQELDDVMKTKKAIISEAVDLSEEQAAKFWPIWQAYEQELKKIQAFRIDIIEDYMEYLDAMTADIADTFVEDFFDNLKVRLELKYIYYKQLKNEVGGIPATEWLQMEHYINQIVDIKISSELPDLKASNFLDYVKEK